MENKTKFVQYYGYILKLCCILTFLVLYLWLRRKSKQASSLFKFLIASGGTYKREPLIENHDLLFRCLIKA